MDNRRFGLSFLASLTVRQAPWQLGFIVVASALSLLLALALRFDCASEEIWPLFRFAIPLLVLSTGRMFSFTISRTLDDSWRFFSLHEVMRLSLVLALSSLIWVAGIFVFRVPFFPRSVIAIEFALALLVFGGARLLVRIAYEQFDARRNRSTIQGEQSCLVVGAGRSGHFLVKVLQARQPRAFTPVGVFDDNEKLTGSTVHGVRVLGPIRSLRSFLEEHPSVKLVILAIPTLPAIRVQEIRTSLEARGVHLTTLRSFDEIAVQEAAGSNLQMLSVEELLNKSRAIVHDQDTCCSHFGKCVMVTGGGGSIGSEIVRQLAELLPSRLVIFDNSEFNLYKIGHELSKFGEAIDYRLAVGDVRDNGRLAEVINQERPAVVYHAAALKHVPLSEDNPAEVFKTNIVGTLNVLDVSRAAGVSRVVLISSDKAVAPLNVMGMSKNIAERLVQEAARSNGSDASGFSAVAVRFGNVINSAGSVIPLFKEQILAGQPLTVTHPAMERYFMSVQEAVQLVLTAGTFGKGGEVFVLDMGKKIKVIELARLLATLYGRPNTEIVITGLRSGERLTEEILSASEQTEPSPNPKVWMVRTPYADKGRLAQEIRELESRINQLDPLVLQGYVETWIRGVIDGSAARATFPRSPVEELAEPMV